MSKAARERSARDRLAAERARQAARQKQIRLLALVVGVVVAVAAVVAIVVVVADQKSKRNQVAERYTGPQAPLSRQADGSIVMAKAGVTKPVLEIFEDFQCPHCAEFEKTEGKTVKSLAAEGKVKVVYRPFNLFSQQPDPSRGNSQRAAAAALCVPAAQWLSYHDALFKYQPAEGTGGFSIKDLVAWGKDVGVTDPKFSTCVTKQEKDKQVGEMTSYTALTRKVDSTPTLVLDGKKLTSQQMSDLTSAIAGAK
ncbi:DSBA-like thioredoxin domain protein [Actinomadura rubteroloni]|uniref:DSBA-like thioredoxin domain protein n=1 Tax=Actinomadura rubteroloni TaxID=1926885 RepID=A0A2P4UFY1_9ACTN|nr:thioredoxin domain-containing protein [Actinomadura rubteroloni]POM23945.1 DSBA-like thioredoxin domain protein [Actinomadura rubteroloni]